MLDFLKMLLTPEFFFSIIRISAPILFATLAAIVVEKAGFCNIGLEGLMMFSALTGSLVSYYAHSWVWGLLAALAIGVLMSLMMGFFAFQLKTDITLVGIAVNMMGSGGTLFLCKVITNLSEGTSMASSTGLITSKSADSEHQHSADRQDPLPGQHHFGTQPADVDRVHLLRAHERDAV